VIKLSNIQKSYSLGEVPLHVLKGINLEIATGDFVSIMGHSGSGKSTLLNIIGLLDRHDSGQYWFDGSLIQGYSEAESAVYRNRNIGFVFQFFHLIQFKSALENVTLPLYYRKVPRKDREKLGLKYLDRVGLKKRAHHFPMQMSGGEQQRVAIARALITKPRLVLADEPTGALDSKTSGEIMELFADINSIGITVVIVTHESDIAAMTNRTIVMSDGIITPGTSDGKPVKERT
jgi:putative ABC transport system ATP-binding protein